MPYGYAEQRVVASVTVLAAGYAERIGSSDGHPQEPSRS
jgi:hypothetical protein